MLVCHCHRVCHRRVLEAVAAGARSAEQVGAACGAGTACGGCLPTIGALLSSAPATGPADNGEQSASAAADSQQEVA